MIKYKVVFNVDNGLKWCPNEEEILEVCGYDLEEELYFDTIPSKEQVMELFGKIEERYKEFVQELVNYLEAIKLYEEENDYLLESKLTLFDYKIYELTYAEETDDFFDYDTREEIIIFE